MVWYIFALASSLLRGSTDILKKKALEKEHTAEFMTISYLLGFLLLLLFITNFKLLSFRNISLIFIRSTLMFVAMMTFTKALKHMPISTVSPLTSFKPLFTFILSFFLLGETLSLVQFSGMFIIIFGSYVLESDGHLKNYRKPLEQILHSKYIHYVLIFNVFISIVSIFSKVILTQADPYNVLLYHYFFSTLIYGCITFYVYDGWSDIKEGFALGGVWIPLSTVGGTLATYFIYLAYAVPDSKVSIIATIIQLSVLVSVLLGGKLFKEKNIMPKFVASLLMIAGVYLLFR